MYVQKQLELKLNTSHKHARIKVSLFTYSILELCSYKIYMSICRCSITILGKTSLYIYSYFIAISPFIMSNVFPSGWGDSVCQFLHCTLR